MAKNASSPALETVTLPPTPPSSSSSDSEGGQSPNRSAPSSPQRSLSAMRHQTLRTLSQPVFSSPVSAATYQQGKELSFQVLEKYSV